MGEIQVAYCISDRKRHHTFSCLHEPNTWKKFSNRHGVSMMTVVNGECKSTNIYTGNLLSKGWQHTVCQKLSYKIKQKFYIEGWKIEKMLTKTHNLIPIIYFYFNFTSLNPFRVLSKQRKNKLHHPRKHHLPPEIFLICLSPPCTSCRLRLKVPFPSTPRGTFFQFPHLLTPTVKRPVRPCYWYASSVIA